MSACGILLDVAAWGVPADVPRGLGAGLLETGMQRRPFPGSLGRVGRVQVHGQREQPEQHQRDDDPHRAPCSAAAFVASMLFVAHEHMCPTCLAFWPCEVGGCDDGLFGPCAPCAALLEE